MSDSGQSPSGASKDETALRRAIADLPGVVGTRRLSLAMAGLALILLAAFASHGDTKHPLLFPATPKECFEMTADAFDLAERLQTKCPIPKTIQKAPSGVRTSLPATNGIAAFAVTASCTRRWYANTLLTSIRRQCRRVCTSTSTAQFGSERNSHDHALNAARSSVKIIFPPEPAGEAAIDFAFSDHAVGAHSETAGRLSEKAGVAMMVNASKAMERECNLFNVNRCLSVWTIRTSDALTSTISTRRARTSANIACSAGRCSEAPESPASS